MTDIQAKLAALPPEKRALFEKMLAERGLAEATFPISVMQRGIWFLEQLKPNNPAYVIPAALHLRGKLDADVLLRAINEIARRHESLRTRFEVRDGKPTQVVKPQLTLELPAIDLRGQKVDVEQAVLTALDEPFDLAVGPLLRFKLLHLRTDEYVLAMATHHLVSDGWSVGVLVSELSALYAAYLAGKPSPLPELKIQYGDFATWQQKRSGSEDLTYWREHLAGVPPVLELATDRPRPAVQGFNGGSVPFELPETLMHQLAVVGKRYRATTYMALLAAFNVLLHRYSNQEDVVVGVPTANREKAEIEPLIGFFVNTLPVRADLSGEPSFADVVERVREGCLGVYRHQDVPFEKIVEQQRQDRDLSRSPVFQVSLSYQSDQVAALNMPGLEIRRVPLRADGARFDLELQFFDDSGRLTGWFEYDRDLFDEASMARMAQHLRRIIELAVANPTASIGKMDLLDDDERRELVVTRNDTPREWPGVGWIHQCFEERARTSPSDEAVRFEGESLSYGELNARANRLARKLIKLGVGRDVLVGVSMERSLELVVSLMAVLKAGGAYVPMDPGYPRSRLEYMLEDANVPVLLTQRRVLEVLPPVDTKVLCVEELDLTEGPAADPNVPVGGLDLAYVIYTSGSTGKPKGVMNVHAAIRNRLLWMQDEYSLDGTDKVLQKTPFSFDVSVWEFFWPLMTGATLVVARPDGHKDGRYLVDTIRTEGVTTLHFVPSMLQIFLQEDGVEELTSLRRVVCSGEALPQQAQERFFERTNAELHNLYGPTEAAVDVTYWACVRDGDPRPVPIGHPIANTQMYVLDKYLRPVPAGVPGELHIGGRNLARGYLNRPELTAEKFVRSPFARVPGGRLYKTGDLARYRNDGALEFLGRLDHQVKLRGFRIELGEIESVLAAHDSVREVVVLAKEFAGDTKLIAYLTGDEPDTTTLIGFLKEKLPEFMVPSAFVVLPEFPLTPNGKMDRKALPEPSFERPDIEYVAPGEGLEEQLAAMWKDLLKVERVGAQDNFFDLGGHSLLMSEFRNVLAANLGHQVTMVELFQYPTVGALAVHLRTAGGAKNLEESQNRAENRRQSQDRRRAAAGRRASARKA